MKLREMLMVALEGVWVNKLRSALTMLGIIIGVLSVIIIVTLGQSLQKQTATEVERLGVNSFTLVAVRNDDGQKGKLTIEDLNFIEDSIESIDFIVPMTYAASGAAFETPRKKLTGMLIGTSPDYLKISTLGLEKGRFFTEVENQMGRRVVVINQKMAEELFGTGVDAIGKTVRINRIPFVICGLSKPEAQVMGMQSYYSYVPAQCVLEMEETKEIQQALVRVKNAEQFKVATNQTIRMLEMRQGIKKGFVTQTNEQMMAQINTIVGAITGVFGALAGIALVVGGIGIMNIMLVSVTERTREIGIRIAVGARRKDILIQFLVEALVISAIGGTIGMLLGIGIGALISVFLGMPVVISYQVIIISFLFSSSIGIAFGIYPANRAAKLDPIDALRYE
jgi:putative ABC transport system permease protein